MMRHISAFRDEPVLDSRWTTFEEIKTFSGSNDVHRNSIDRTVKYTNRDNIESHFV